MSNASNECLPKDFVETHDGYFFAVLVDGLRDGRVICFPRYVRSASDPDRIVKINPQSALKQIPQKYQYRCEEFDQLLAGVSSEDIRERHCPIRRAEQIAAAPRDELEQQVGNLLTELRRQTTLHLKQTGVTGSLLIGVHHQDSDIDLVCRDRHEFDGIRKAFFALSKDHSFTSEFWREYYQRTRQELDFEEFVWHETRKSNRLNWHGTKVDLSLCVPQSNTAKPVRSRKTVRVRSRAKVTCDRQAFDYPAVWEIEHAEAHQLVCWDPRYFGQARRGEEIEFAAWLEIDDDGLKKFLVGSTREAVGEYIRVIQPAKANN